QAIFQRPRALEGRVSLTDDTSQTWTRLSPHHASARTGRSVAFATGKALPRAVVAPWSAPAPPGPYRRRCPDRTLDTGRQPSATAEDRKSANKSMRQTTSTHYSLGRVRTCCSAGETIGWNSFAGRVVLLLERGRPTANSLSA